IIRDLLEIALNMVKTEHMAKVQEKAKMLAEDRVLDLLLPQPRAARGAPPEEQEKEGHNETRERLRVQLKEGKLDSRYVDVDVKEETMPFGVISNVGLEELEINLKEMLGSFLPEKSKRKKVRVSEALAMLIQEEANKLIDMEKVTAEARDRTEQTGIVFLDEIDKIASRAQGHGGPEVSREGVQRDLLPVVEGTTVNTKHGPVRTDHVLFIAAGAFHTSKPSDLMPELQGRFPIRVELTDLTRDDFLRVLTEPKHALTKQYAELLKTEGVELE